MQPVQEDICRKAVHDAFHAGINFFDTSPFYGATKAETVSAVASKNRASILEAACGRGRIGHPLAHPALPQMLGKTIQGLPRSEIVISTKVGSREK